VIDATSVTFIAVCSYPSLFYHILPMLCYILHSTIYLKFENLFRKNHPL